MSLSEMKAAKGGVIGGNDHPPEPENLQCPRCESTNTKFCYYNNYNLSQPRYFCKSCRRYWTRGGSLRNVPVGGGSRKNSKRLRRATSPPLPLPPPISAEIKAEVNLNDAVPGSFSSFLASNHAGGFLGLGGYSIGLGPETGPSHFEMLGLGFGKDWGGINVSGGGSSGGSSSGCNTWQMDGTDGGDCFGWPDLAISTPGTAGLE